MSLVACWWLFIFVCGVRFVVGFVLIVLLRSFVFRFCYAFVCNMSLLFGACCF